MLPFQYFFFLRFLGKQSHHDFFVTTVLSFQRTNLKYFYFTTIKAFVVFFLKRALNKTPFADMKASYVCNDI